MKKSVVIRMPIGKSNEVFMRSFSTLSKAEVSYDEMAVRLKAKFCSKDGKELTASHLSNFSRKDLGIRRCAVYSKPRYKGRNHVICKREQN